MKILCISDTHGQHEFFTQQINDIEADVLIHAGDVTKLGTNTETFAFIDWLNQFKHIPHKLFVGGNHDKFLENYSPKDYFYTLRNLPNGIRYLENNGVKIGGKKFYGSPYTPAFMNWHFMYSRGEEGKKLWAKVPDDTDVLITHGPPKDVLDRVEGWGGGHVGCDDLAERLYELKRLKLHVFGHIHNGYGIGKEHMGNDQFTEFVNASLLNEYYQPVHKPILIEL